MEFCSIIGSSFICESLVFSEISLLADQYLIIVLKKFVQTSEALFFLTSKPVLCQTPIILKHSSSTGEDEGKPIPETMETLSRWITRGWRKPPALSSHECSYEQVNPLSKWLTLNFNIFSSCPPFLGSFHTCGFPLLDGSGNLLSNLLCSTPGWSDCHRQWHEPVKMLQGKGHFSHLKQKKLGTAAVRWAEP